MPSSSTTASTSSLRYFFEDLASFLKNTISLLWCCVSSSSSARDEEESLYGTSVDSVFEDRYDDARYDIYQPVFDLDPFREPLLARGSEREHAARRAFYTTIRNGGSVEAARRVAGYSAIVGSLSDV